MWLLITCQSFFFFKQKTAYEIRPRDWSSDVCSSDLGAPTHTGALNVPSGSPSPTARTSEPWDRENVANAAADRSSGWLTVTVLVIPSSAPVPRTVNVRQLASEPAGACNSSPLAAAVRSSWS